MKCEGICYFLLLILIVHNTCKQIDEKCTKGIFTYQDKEYKSCPEDTYADNYSQTCKKEYGKMKYINFR
jgi:hypothetical protein